MKSPQNSSENSMTRGALGFASLQEKFVTSLPKIALSLLISILMFAGCLLFSFAGGFKIIEVQYYAPRVIGNINSRLEKIKSGYGDYFTVLDEQFRNFMGESSVSSYIEREPSKENMDLRDNLCSNLFRRNNGLDGIRLIESDGVHVHYSTFREDILTETQELITYNNYEDRIPYALIESSDGEKKTLVYFDNVKNRLLFSYPFYDVYTAFRGTMVFYVAGDDFTRYLIDKDLVSLNARGTVVSPFGYVFGLPLSGRDELLPEIQKRWQKNYSNVEQLIPSDSKKENLFVVSTTETEGIKIGWICSRDEFEFTEVEKTALFMCLFVTMFLLVFLLFNLRHDDMVLIRRRIRRFQYELLKEYINRKDTRDWKTLSKEVAARRMDVNDEIKRSLGRRGKKHSDAVDALLEESWRDIMSAVGGTRRQTVSISQEETEAEKAETPVVVQEIPRPVEPAEPVEELEEVEEAEPVEELEEVEEAEPVEELEEVEEAEPVEELEEVEEAEPADDVEELEEAEEIPEAEPVSDAEPMEVIEESFSEYAKKDFPEKEIPKNAEEIRQRVKDSFSVASPNFSSLDGENS